MSAQSQGAVSGAAQAAGANLAIAVLSTPQGQAAAAATAGLVVACIPPIAIGAAAVGAVCALVELAKSICR